MKLNIEEIIVNHLYYKDMTVQEFANSIHANRTTVARYMNGDIEAGNVMTIQRVLKACGYELVAINKQEAKALEVFRRAMKKGGHNEQG